MDTLFQFGYVGLFIISFLAASLLPLSSELFVLAMLPLGYNIWWVGIVATAGNFAGALLNYYIGKKGTEVMLGRFFDVKEGTRKKAEQFYERWGQVSLFFSWVPIIGDPLTAVSGAMKLDLRIFTFWVVLGKALRYVVLLGLAQQLDFFK